MFRVLFAFVTSLLASVSLVSAGAVGGGGACAGCSIVVGLLEQIAVMNEMEIDEVMDELCKILPSDAQQTCDTVVTLVGDDVVALVQEGYTGDEVCSKLELCTLPIDECHLWPLPGADTSTIITQVDMPHRVKENTLRHTRAFRKWVEDNGPLGSIWDWLADIIYSWISSWANGHVPLEDVDGDRYSDVEGFRGSHWRGRDCDDFDATVHPGRAKRTSDTADKDHNCNGIYGLDETTGKAYEDEFCAGTGAMGVAVVGDSVGAHFEIPPGWLTPSQMLNASTWSNLFPTLVDEFDWPQRSATTGYEKGTNLVPVDSLYLRLRELNRCNHRDFQNCAVNGERVGPVDDQLKYTLNRNQTIDNPLLLIYELVGNDVCSGHHDFTHMTTPEEFYTSVVGALDYFDTILPAGSIIVMVGLAEGEILWNSLYNRTHPVGVKYPAVYDYLNCLELSPCWGFMNSNETVRNITNARAQELSAIYPQIIANHTYENFEMVYTPFPMSDIMAEWEENGGEAWQLIEPVDGFHPNQQANYLLGGWLWNFLQTEHGDLLPPENPNNDQIEMVFGDQGGY